MKNLFKKDKNNEVPARDAENGVLPENGGDDAATKSKLKLDKRMIMIICAACLAVVCIVLAIVLPLCLSGGEDEYFTLKYDAGNPQGVNIIIGNEDGEEVKNGWEVKSGLTVTFTLGYDGEAEGAPTVKINGAEIKPNNLGVYSFVMRSDTVIGISGVFVKMNYKVTFDRGVDKWVHYSSNDFDASEPLSVMGGERITFDVGVSVYYKQSGFTVVANTVVVKPGDDGHYSFTVIGDTTVKVVDLVQEDAFSARLAEDGKTYYTDGEGTEENPYRIRKPIDLYAMADLIGDDFNQGSNYQTAYYRLENDIDMKGERVYIIGDGFTTSSSLFAGNFNGNNKTISNYYMADEIVEQANFTRVFTPYIGLFGLATATTRSAATIYDLNLENFTIEVTHADKVGFSVGGVVGMGEGATISNCSAKGKIRAVADAGLYPCKMGGIIGYQRAVSNGVVSYAGVVNSCYADVEIAGESGFIECAGGIAGHVVSYDAVTPAYILNSYATGDVYGAVRTGGIAGAVSAFSSIKNSYSTGVLEARSDVDTVGYEVYHNAYAGGIAGYVDHGAIISDSFFAGEVYAHAMKGSDCEKTGGTAAYVEVKSVPAGSFPALVLNSFHDSDGSLINAEFLKNTLKWDDADWTFAGKYPAINKEPAEKSFAVTVNLGSGNAVDGKNVYTLQLKDVYSDMASLYTGIYAGNKRVPLPRYLVSDAGLRSYGYYFDRGLTQRIPDSYIPTTDMTIYTGFVNYNDVVGRYYLQSGVNGGAVFADYRNIDGVCLLTTPLTKGAYIDLKPDGSLEYRNGVISVESTYYYDGSRITLQEVYVTFEEYRTYDDKNKPVVDVSSSYITLYADAAGGNLSIYDGDLYLASRPLKAVKKLVGFDYGYYYNGSVTYLFNPDMTGEKTANNVTTEFTYTLTSNTVVAGSETINLADLTPFDALYGTWEKSAGSNKKYVFDGKGNYTYEEFGYDASGNKVVYNAESTRTGTYSVSSLSNGKTVAIKDGLLVIGGETYYKQNSFAGTWRFPGRVNVDPLEITFGGISAQGYGEAVVNYGDYYGKITLGYHAVTAEDGSVTIELYNGDFRYGILLYDPVEKTLTGEIISAANSTSTQAVTVKDAKFFLYDDFKGSWVSNSEGFELVDFNGLGNYDLLGNNSHIKVAGEIKINGVSAGKYELISGKLEGSFVYNGLTYSLVYDEDLKIIRIATSGGNIELVSFDGWEKVVLKAADGTEYAFDGRGNIAGNGGKVTVTSAGGNTATYAYGMSGGLPQVDTLGAVTVGSGASSGKYVLNGVDLSLKTDFAAAERWHYQNGGSVGVLTIGDIGPDGKGGYEVEFSYGGTLSGSSVSGGTTVKGAYDSEHNEIYVEDADGNVTFSISVMKNEKETALSFAYVLDDGIKSHVCIAALDGFVGEYVSSTGEKLVLDGFGSSEFASGEAVKYDKDGTVSGKYIYLYKEDEERPGEGELRLSETVKVAGTTVIISYVLKEVAEGAEAFGKDGKFYNILVIDDLYNVSAFLRTSFNNVDPGVLYKFDGVGGITETKAGNKTEYSYRMISYNSLMLTYSLYVTDKDGKIYLGELNLSAINSFRLTEKDRFFRLDVYGLDKDGKVDVNVRYRFDGNGSGTMTYINGADATNYEYKLVEDSGNVCTFELTLPNDKSKKFLGVLTFGKEFDGEKYNVLTITEINN